MPACSLLRLNSMQVVLGQGETLLKTSRLCSRAGVYLSLRSPSGLALRSEQKRDISVVGVNQDLSLGINSRHYLRLLSLRKSMSTSGSKTVLGDVYIDDMISGYGSVSDFSKSTGVYFADRSLHSCKRASFHLRCRNPTQNNVVCGHSMFDMLRRSPNSNPLVRPWLRSIHSMPALCYSSGASPDVTFEGSSQTQDGQVTVSEASPHRSLKLLSGSCYLPHPEKEETGGEDAHFICADKQVIGVADGVGGWADVGVNAGLFAQELMLNSVAAIQEESKGSIDPARVLEKAHSGTKAKGSSTACIIALSDQGIHAINLGDSGFIVVRDGCTIFESPVQQHGFNFTYQLECGNGGDLPRSGQVFNLPVVPGDVIVAGTDGLFDNLYKNEVTAVVVDAVRSGLEPQAAAQKITALARQRALEKNRQTPFSTAAQEAGYRYYGGKLDDITVVVSYITSSTSP